MQQGTTKTPGDDSARASVQARVSSLRRRAEATPSSASLTDGLGSSFARACAAAADVSAERYRIAGAPVCLQFASAALRERITPALSHLRDDREHERPALT